MDWWLIAGIISYLSIAGLLLFLTFKAMKHNPDNERVGIMSVLACVFWPITIVIFLIAIGTAYARR